MTSNRAKNLSYPITNPSQDAPYQQMYIPAQYISREGDSPFQTTLNKNKYNSWVPTVGNVPNIDKPSHGKLVSIQANLKPHVYHNTNNHQRWQPVRSEDVTHYKTAQYTVEGGLVHVDDFIPTTVQHY
jgi:hypothetical protein